MEKELVELFEIAKKAADSAALDGASSTGPEVSRCLDALKQLKRFPVTYDMLVATQVGKRLRSLAKHPTQRIQTVAGDLLEVWKKVVIEETAKGKKNGVTEKKPSSKTESVKTNDIEVEKVQIGNQKVDKVSKSEPVKAEKVNEGDSAKKKKEAEADCGESAKVEKVPKEEKQTLSMRRPLPNGPPKLTELVKCNDSMRNKVRELLVEALSKVADEADEEIKDKVDTCDPIRVAVAVESAMFEKLGGSNGKQKVKYRSIMFNMKDSNNPDLRRKVLLGEVEPYHLINMTPEEMASERRKRENSQIKEKALFECERGAGNKATTDQFKCGRCGQRKCTYYQMQTRSADEPMTTYVTCVNCNNRWKFC